MNNRSNNWLGLLILAVLLVIVFLRDDWSGPVRGMAVDHYESLVIEDYQQLEELAIDLGRDNLEILTHQENTIEVTFPIYNTDDYQLEVSHEEQHLSISSRENRDWKPTDNQATVTVYLPEGITLDQFDLHLQMGEAKIEGLQSQTSRIDLAMGSLIANNCQLGRLDLEVAMGSCELNQVELADSSSIGVDMGDLTGQLKPRGDDITIEVDMGTVDISLYGGDYYVQADADMGESDISSTYLEPQAADAKLMITADMGDITVHSMTKTRHKR